MLALWLILGLSVGQAQIHFVRAGGTGSGISWVDASGDLQGQINASAAGDQVWVAAGTYKPTTGTDRSASFAMKNGVAIYGGFPPSGSPTMAQRNPNSFTTTLSGELGSANFTDNSYHVIKNPEGLNNTAVLDGFVITGGYAGGGSADRNGAGMYNQNSSPSLRNCNFISNIAEDIGAGMYNQNSSSPSLTNCSFQRNRADEGGGMVNFNSSSPSLTNCSFISNAGLNSGGGVSNQSGSNPILINCSFERNFANRGGGMDIFGGSTSLTNCSFLGNEASVSGGIETYGGDVSLINCVFFGNGGTSTFNAVSGGSVVASYSLFETGTDSYSGSNNLTTSTSPFMSTTSVALNACATAINAGNNAAYPGRQWPFHRSGW